MRFSSFSAAALAIAGSVSAADLSPVKSILQVSPSFSGDGVSMFPGRHPNHDPLDLSHLVPQLNLSLYYAQEGHRPAVDGTKHAQMEATFSHPTVVLDHSDHIQGITCSRDEIEVCFSTPGALMTVQKTWKNSIGRDVFNLVTFHVGCGDTSGQKRSFFRASQPVSQTSPSCVRVPAMLIDEENALHSGEVAWGTYKSPTERRRARQASGHVKATVPNTPRTPPGGTVDLTVNEPAAKKFFNTTQIDPNGPGPQHPIGFVSSNGTVYKRDVASFDPKVAIAKFIWQGIADNAEKVGLGILKWRQNIKEILQFGAESVLFLAEAFTVGVDKSYHRDYEINKFLTPEASTKGQKIFGESGGYLVPTPPKPENAPQYQAKKDVTIQCMNCGVEASLTVDGRFAFHRLTGITAGNLQVQNHKDLKASANIGITFEGSYPIFKKKWQAPGYPLTPITVPGIFVVGPELTIGASFNVDFSGEVQLIVGGTMTLSKGTATLDLKKEHKCQIPDGDFKASFEPKAEAKGSAKIAASLGVPFGLEFGLDVLSGKFKKTVALVNTPALYVQAGTSFNNDSPCKGLELRLGVRNKVEINALDEWSYTIRNDTLYDKGLGCVTPLGFDKDAVKPDSGVFVDVARKFGGEKALVANEPTKPRDIAKDLNSGKDGNTWSLIWDKAQTSLLVSGIDGYAYLEASKQGYDLTAPWGTTESSTDMYGMDVLGRVMNIAEIDYRKTKGFIVAPQVIDPRRMPKYNWFAMLAELRDDKNKDKNSSPPPYGIWLSKLDEVYYPTVCKVSGKGIRLYATRDVVGEGGKVYDSKGKENTAASEYFTTLGLTQADCRTVRLSSDAYDMLL